MKKSVAFQKNIKLILTVIILLQSLIITFVFAYKKKGFHSDEIWNYGFANSTEGGYIYEKDGEKINCYEWVNSEKLLEYISVDKSEIFAYKDVYINCAKDINPPLQNMLLHLICSFFPNVWSKWFCFVINIFAFFLTQIFLYKTILLTGGDEKLAVMGIILYGFGAGAANVSIFLRIYALGVAFSVMYIYYSAKIFRDEYKKSNYIKLFAVGFLGAFTIHQFLIIAFVVTFAFSAYYLIKRKYKKMFAYGGTGLLFAGLSIAAFPSTIAHMNGKTASYEVGKLPLMYQLSKYFEYLNRDIIGIHNSANPTFIHSVFSMIIGLAFAILLAILYVFRKKEKVKKIKNGIFDFVKRMIEELKKYRYPVIAFFICVLVFLFIVSGMTSLGRMGEYTRRYIFLIYPVYSALVIMIIKAILNALKINESKIDMLMLCITAVLVILSYAMSDKAFYFNEKKEGITFSDLEEDTDCIVVLDSLWLSTCATNELYNTDMFYLTDRANYEHDNYADLDLGDRSLYLLIDVSNEYIPKENDDEETMLAAQANGSMINKDEILEYYGNLSIAQGCELCGCDYLFGRKIEIYKLTP